MYDIDPTINPSKLDINDFKDVEMVLKNSFFDIVGKIGSGSFGQIYKVTNFKEKKEYVAKIVKFGNDGNFLEEFTKNEIDILYQHGWKCPNLVKLIFYKVMRNGFLIVMEYAEKGDLYELIKGKNLSEDEFFVVFKEIFNGVKHLHENKIEHRDLKLENILVNNLNQIKICDFGLASIFETLYKSFSSSSGTYLKRAEQVGSPQCLSPEAIQEINAPFGSVDIWSLGCIAYFLIFGFYPFEKSSAKDLEELKSVILKEDINYFQKKHMTISKDCINFLSLMLEKNPRKRLKIDQIQKHPFYSIKEKNIDQNFSKNCLKNLFSTQEKSKNIFASKLSYSKPFAGPEKDVEIEKGYDSDQTVQNSKVLNKNFAKIPEKQKNDFNNGFGKFNNNLANNKGLAFAQFTSQLQQKYSDFNSVMKPEDALMILEQEYLRRKQILNKNVECKSNEIKSENTMKDKPNSQNGINKNNIIFPNNKQVILPRKI